MKTQMANVEDTPVYLVAFDGASPDGSLPARAVLSGGFEKQMSDFRVQDGSMIAQSDGWSSTAAACCPDQTIYDFYVFKKGTQTRAHRERDPLSS